MNTVTDLAAFATGRRPMQDRGASALLGSVRWALHRHSKTPSWSRTIVNAAERVFRRTYRTEAGKMTSRQLRETVAQFRDTLRLNLDRTGPPTDGNFDAKAEAIARWVSNAAINGGTQAAGAEDHTDPDRPNIIKTWITMHDDRVRDTHRSMDGVSVGLDQTFSVAGHPMKYPGDPIAPPDLTVNCRCVLAIRAATLAADANLGVTMTVTAPDFDLDSLELDDDPSDLDADTVSAGDEVEVPWHGVLAPEDVMSGDGRKFGVESLRWRDLPLPLGWQKVTATGHDGAVVVGRIDEVWREGNLIKASGMFLLSDESNEAIGLIADGGIRGVSVDVDDATMELQNSDGSAYEGGDDQPVTVFPTGRICGATLCAIPAFSEAFVSLGDWEQRGEITAAADHDCACEFAIDEGRWSGSASNYTDEQYYRATIIHLVTSGPDRLKKANNKLPILTPDGKLSRAGVHAAVSRLGSTDAPPEKVSQAKAALRTAYRELKEEPPETITGSADEDREFDDLNDFVKTEDGPGWLTHPVDTERLRRYWTKGPGAAKIRWGTPGDFNRCRSQLAKYVKPQYLSGYCANRHYDATGFWPGDAPSEGGGRGRKGRHSGETEDLAPSVNLVASALPLVSARFFDDPHLDAPTPVSVREDGRVVGHVATWGTCHIGIKGTCVTPPHSVSGYAYFRTGAVHTDEGDIAVGQITLGTGHAGPGLSASSAAAHYDNTGTAAADVVAGEDAYGIWISGRIRDHLSDEDRHALAAAPLSGDWRAIAGSLEMVAALAVNVGGFPIPRTQLAASGGEQTSLVAAGILDRTPQHLVSALDIGAAVMAAVDEIEARKNRKDMAELARSLGRDPRSRMAALRDSMKV